MRLVSEFLAELKVSVEDERAAITRGAAKTFDEYRYMCGVVKGLESAGRLLEDFVKSKPTEERN
jgi:hypothetical protein